MSDPVLKSEEPSTDDLPSEPSLPSPSENSSTAKKWVKFEEESGTSENVATIEPSQSVHLDKPHPLAESPNKEVPSPPPDTILDSKHGSVSYQKPSPPPFSLPPPKAPSRKQLTLAPNTGETNGIHKGSEAETRNNLQSISLNETAVPVAQPRPSSRSPQRGFSNGDVVVTLLPVNNRCAWVSKAEFRPELVPEELMAEGLTLTVEDYVTAMNVLVNDVRFNVYIACYKRMLLLWIVLGFVVLLSLLFSGVRGLALFGGGIVWLVINAVGIFVCMWLKTKLNHMLERCFSTINTMFLKHNIILGMDDRGKISCQKVNLVFIFFNTSYCLKYLKDMLANEERQLAAEPSGNSIPNGPRINHSRMDIENGDIVIMGRDQRISQKEKTAEKLLLRYSQRWVKEYVRKRLDLSLPLHPDGTEEPGPPLPPRHCSTARCLCQFIDEHLRFKPQSRCSLKDLCAA